MTEKSSGTIDIFTDEGKSMILDVFEENKLYELGINSSFYANLSAKSNNEIFSISLEGAFVSPEYGVGKERPYLR